MVEGPLDPAHVSLAQPQELVCVDLSEAVDPNILWQPKSLAGPLDIVPDRLTGTVLGRVPGRRKDPDLTGLGPERKQEVIRHIDPATLAGLGLSNPELSCQLFGLECQDITQPQTRLNADPADQPVTRHQSGENMFHLPLEQILRGQTMPTTLSTSAT